jgi:hypothetical protein
VKQIAVLRREGHQLIDGTSACLGQLRRADFPAHLGKEQPGMASSGSKTTMATANAP